MLRVETSRWTSVSCSYSVLWNSFKRLTAKYSGAAEKAKLFHDTAARVSTA
jgi:hypothetical protein